MNSRASLDKDTKNGHADEHALQVYQEQNYSSRGRGRGGRFFPRGRGNGRGRGTFDKSKVPQCFTCKKYGHFRKDCWYNDEVQANVAENEENDGEINKKENGDRKDEENKEQRLFLAVAPQDSRIQY